jgi:predicted nucleic acid-binding protein
VRRKDENRAKSLSVWLEKQVIRNFDRRIIPVDILVAIRCAALHVSNPRPDRDALIAATALVHGLVMVTRNITDFQTTGVPLINPWQ